MASGSQYTAPRTSASAGGMATCSLQVRWSKPSRSATVAMRTISSMPAVGLPGGVAPGVWVAIGVMTPSRTPCRMSRSTARDRTSMSVGVGAAALAGR